MNNIIVLWYTLNTFINYICLVKVLQPHRSIFRGVATLYKWKILYVPSIISKDKIAYYRMINNCPFCDIFLAIEYFLIFHMVFLLKLTLLFYFDICWIVIAAPLLMIQIVFVKQTDILNLQFFYMANYLIIIAALLIYQIILVKQTYVVKMWRPSASNHFKCACTHGSDARAVKGINFMMKKCRKRMRYITYAYRRL